MALAGKLRSASLPAAAPHLSTRIGSIRLGRPTLVVPRADPPKVTREYREDDDTISVPGASSSKRSDAIYVDADAPIRAPKPQDNLSKEMKARLRQEYVGFGGAENSDERTAASPPRRPLVAAVVVTAKEGAAATEVPATAAEAFTERPGGATLSAQASTSAVAAVPAGAAAAAASKWVIDENENLRSTAEHRAWTWVSIGMVSATLAQASGQVQSGSDAAAFAGSVFLAYVLSDLGTGVYHWYVDNYGDANTPVFGRQIAAFQGHHQRPWTITQREFCNNVHQVFKPAAYPAAALLTLAPVMPMAWNAWSSTFLFLICMSQQFHAWSHMKKSELPAPAVALQDAGLLISRKMHGAHHRSPFEGNYCIVSGWWNPVLDSTHFFRNLEKLVHSATGIEPRCWHEPQYDWRELERPEQAT